MRAPFGCDILALCNETQEEIAAPMNTSLFDDEMKRRLLVGLLSLLLTTLAARLAVYIADLILGPEEKAEA